MADPQTEAEPKNAHVAMESEYVASVGEAQRPAGWMYKSLKLANVTTWYASPGFQLGIVAFVCFMCPGMFNALSGLGGGGKSDPKLADDMVCLFLLIPTIVVILHLLSSPPGDNCFSHD